MPPVSNQLIRIKVIDKCLRNHYLDYPCTIERMKQLCTDALREIKGKVKEVKTRTIQADLQAMRAEYPGFNAPLKYEDGEYFYEDENYSVFNRTLTKADVLRLVNELLRDGEDTYDKTFARRLQGVIESFESEKDILYNTLPPLLEFGYRESAFDNDIPEERTWKDVFDLLEPVKE